MATKTFVASWNAVVGATSYKVTWYVDGVGAAPASVTGNVSAQFSLAVENGSTVTVQVQACNDAGCSVPGIGTIDAVVEAIPDVPVVTVVQS